MSTVTFLENYLGFLENQISFDELALGTLRIGISYTGASVDGTVGVSYTLYDRRDRLCVQMSPASFEGKSIKELIKLTSSNHSVKRGVGVAVANAVATTILQNNYQQLPNPNFLDYVIKNSSAATKIGMIGNIHPIVRRLRKENLPLTILDVFDPVKDSSQITLANSIHDFVGFDHLLISGSALVFPNWEKLVTRIIPTIDKIVGLVGPSASVHPDFFFSYGFSLIAGSYNKRNKVDNILDVISTGGGYRYFKRYYHKYCFIQEEG